MAGQKVELDWVYLPPDTEPRSLWTCLHDANIESLCSDALKRSLSLSFDVPYLKMHHRLPEDVRFLFFLTGVKSIRAVTFLNWPGPGPDTTGKSYEEQCRLVGEYQSKGREESVSWKEFESDLTQAGFLVHDADLASDGERMALRLQGTWDDAIFYTICLQAEQLSVGRSDGEDFSLDRLQELGDGYWDDFATRAAERKAAGE